MLDNDAEKRVGLHVKCYFCVTLTKTGLDGQIVLN